MRFDWDEGKSDANLEERGFDFAFATLIFEDPLSWLRIGAATTGKGASSPSGSRTAYISLSCSLTAPEHGAG